MTQRFYSHGKLLISGEYAVLDGATALAIPTRMGQGMTVTPAEGKGMEWTGRDEHGIPWLHATFTARELDATPLAALPSEPQGRLLYCLQQAIRLNPGFRERCGGGRVETDLEFPRPWGLGTSSTFIANLAQWAGTDPYALLEATLGGSGYDLACARTNGPIFFRLEKQTPHVEAAPFQPPFAQELRFIFLNAKQDSREGIRRYRQAGGMSPGQLEAISALSTRMATATTLGSFQQAMEAHEAQIASVLEIPPVQEVRFPDFDGCVKSLGAWGGDFVLAAGGTNAPDYFRNLGYTTQVPFSDMLLE